jgi:hypothetical protein
MMAGEAGRHRPAAQVPVALAARISVPLAHAGCGRPGARPLPRLLSSFSLQKKKTFLADMRAGMLGPARRGHAPH